MKKAQILTSKLFIMLAVMMFSESMFSQPILVKDINNVPTVQSKPQQLIEFNGFLFFAKDNGISGIELWKTDGTSGGTQLVKDINPGVASSSPRHFAAAGSTLFFFASDATHGEELWKTDGTEAGTQLVKDTNPGPGGVFLFDKKVIGSTIYFTSGTSSTGTELWKSDGTEAGTLMVKDIAPGSNGSSPANFEEFNGQLFFSAAENNFIRTELWKSDGTSAGTVRVKDINPTSFSFPSQLTVVGSTLFFVADDGVNGEELWKTDGTEAGTVLVKDIKTGSVSSRPTALTPLGDKLLFIVDFAQYWVSDGTEVGTVNIGPSFAQTGSSNLRPIGMRNPVINGKAYIFTTNSPSGQGLYKTNGTIAGTVFVKSLSMPSSTVVTWLNVTNNILYFAITDNQTLYNGGLWKSDGTTAGTQLVANVSTLAQPFYEDLITFNNTLFFVANDGVNGFQIWSSDGTASGTTRITSLSAPTNGSNSFGFTVKGNSIVFTADDAINGAELWKTDGTDVGTSLIKDIMPGSSGGNINSASPSGFVTLGNDLLFSAASGTSQNDQDRELWKTDGTNGGTQLLKNIRPGSGFSGSSSPSNLTKVGSSVYFSANNGTNGIELWKTDGTDAGTVMVKDIRTAGDSNPMNFKAVGQRLFFVAADGVNGQELWTSDGTEQGTTIVKNINPETQGLYQHISNITVFNGRVFFAADGANGLELYHTDGTDAGTVLLKDIRTSGHSFPSQLTVANELLFFTADDGINGTEIWKTDGTEANTLMLKNIKASGSSNPAIIGEINGKLLFIAEDGVRGRGIWQSDGTAGGTHLMKTFSGSNVSISLGSAKLIGNMLVFPLYTEATGWELWQSNGTSEGTTMVGEIGPGSLNGFDYMIQTFDAGIIGNTIYFKASDGSKGQELWKYEVNNVAACTERIWYYDPDGNGIGDLNITFASCTKPIGYVSNNSDPLTSGIANVNVSEDASDYVINLYDAFSDAEDSDVNLTYTITGNTNTGLFNAATISIGTLTLDFKENAFGSAQLTIRATDTGGSYAEGSFVLTISPVADSPSVTSAVTTYGEVSLTGLIIANNPSDGAEVTHYKIFSISNGQLFQNDGITIINSGDFISSAQGSPGLKFRPSAAGTGSFEIQASLESNDSGLGGDKATAVITISKATLIAKANNSSKIYGEDIPALTVAYAGFVNGDDIMDIDTHPTAITVATALSDVNQYDIDITGGTDDNYNIVADVIKGKLTINKAILTAKADGKSKTFGETNPPLTISYIGLVNGDDASFIDTPPSVSTIATTSSNAGQYDIEVTGGMDNNYIIVADVEKGKLTINQAILTAKADNKSKIFGMANPTFTVSYIGFVGGDGVLDIDTAPTLSTSATISSAAGQYDIELSGGTDNNYIIVADAIKGTLTINKATQTISFAPLADKLLSSLGFSLTATSTSGLSVLFASPSDKVTLSGNQLTLVKPGRVVIRADQSGNDSYLAAESVEHSFCINPLPPNITVDITNPASPVLTSSSNVGNQWFLNGTAITGATDKTHTVAAKGSYQVKVMVDNCVSELSEAKIFIVTGDLEQVKSEQATLFPNPVENRLVVRLNGFDPNHHVTINMIDGMGRRITELTEMGEKEISMEVGQIASGIYFVQLMQGKETQLLRFIKK